ncbi:hypothetical protein GGX14DRAFT_394480 [Mycena pura]|uniref:Uncharacterized protein n=1 Tax=Mycena pura TaxID=153505 RepID=A0AAD6VIH4_9AGAR|nr:hypothetical protein GGX14DRAFT_394480 [Mycena pura]
MIALRVQCVHSNTSEICDSMYMNIRNIPSQNGGKGGVILRAGQNLECGGDDHDSAWHSVPDVPKLVLRDRRSCNVGSRRDVVKRAAGATRYDLRCVPAGQADSGTMGRRQAAGNQRETGGGRGRATRGGGGRGQEILMSACSDCSNFKGWAADDGRGRAAGGRQP